MNKATYVDNRDLAHMEEVNFETIAALRRERERLIAEIAKWKTLAESHCSELCSCRQEAENDRLKEGKEL